MTKHVKGPGGVHDVPDDHPAVAQAAENQGGWRFATDEEIEAMYGVQGVEVPEGVLSTPKAKKKGEEPSEGVASRATPLPSTRK